MGAKQSKRSVDISGKEAEGAGEVAAAGAGGEGRVEPLADADALKPQLNGDAHIHEQTDKEKQLDSGTPENEKDATTEKEGKQEDAEKDKEAAPVANGESEEQKTEHGDSAPTPDDAKKPKKEKVKKKWSLRSISFSRKDKPKQEKKQKEEEVKTNGEPEKVPEEAAEVTPEPLANEVAEVKPETETKEEKTPETPVTEPITNGSNTPESPKVEIPVAEEAAPVASPESDKTEPETKPETEPEQLPVNGLSLEETKSEEAEIPKVEESKPDESPAESTETGPAIEIPVKKEVCVEQMPLIEPTPPPLPANPPPSSVASFAATTMAPDLADASLANTAENTISTPPAVLDTKTETPKEIPTEIQTDLTNPEKTSLKVPSSVTKTNNDIEIIKQENSSCNGTADDADKTEEPVAEVVQNEVKHEVEELVETKVLAEISEKPLAETLETPVVLTSLTNEVADDLPTILPEPAEPEQISVPEPVEILPEPVTTTEEQMLPADVNDELPPPPPADDEINAATKISTDQVEKSQEVTHEANEIVNSNYCGSNGIGEEALNGNEETEQENIKNKKKDALGNVIEKIECNGNIDDVENVTKDEVSGVVETEESLPPSPSEAEAGAEASDSFPAPPSDPASPRASPQEPLAVSDKLADLIPEVPVVPELKTDTALVSGAADN